MPEAIIKYSDLIEDDGGFVKLEKDLESLGKRLEVKGKDIQKSLKLVDVRDTAEISRLETEVKTLSKAYTQLKTEKVKLETVKKKSIQLSKEEKIALEKEREATRQSSAEAKNIAKIKMSQVGSIEQLKAKLALVSIAWSKLSAEERNNSALGTRIIASKKALTEELKKEEMATGSAQRNVGNYKESVKEAIREMEKEKIALTNTHKLLKEEQALLKTNTAEYKLYQKEIDKTDKELDSLNLTLGEGSVQTEKLGSSFSNIKGLIASAGLAFGAFSLVKGAGSLVIEFEQSIANLGALTGTTGDNLANLKDKVLEVSNATGKSASSISEAMQKVGGAQPELLKDADALAEVTKQAVILAQAGGIDVPDAADALTKSMNQFGVGAEKAAEYIDILATSQQKGTATIGQIAEAMKVGGGTVRAFGGDFQQANAILQAFAKGGVVGSEAGTQMAGVLSKLAKVQNKDFNPQFTDSVKVIDNLSKANLSYGDLIKLTDAEGAKWLTTLINQNKVVQDLNGNLYDQGSAMKQANQVTDTVAGQYERMTTAIQNQILGTEGATDASNKLKFVLKFVGENIGSIISVIGKATMAWITYKAVTKVLAFTDMVKLNGGIGETIKGMVGMKKSTEDAGKATSGFGNAMKAVGITAFIALLAEVVTQFLDIVSGADRARDRVEAFNKAMESGAKFGTKTVKSIEGRLKKEQDLLDLKKAQGKLTEKEYQTEKENIIKNYRSKIVVIKDLAKEERRKALNAMAWGQEAYDLERAKNEFFQDQEILSEYEAQQASVLNLNKEIAEYVAFLEKTDDELHNVNVTQAQATTETVTATKETKKNTTELADNNTELEKRLQLLMDEARLRHELSMVDIQVKQAKVENDISAELALRKKQAKELGNADLSNLNELLNIQSELKKQALTDELNFKLSELKKNAEKETLLKIDELDKEKEELLKQEKLTTVEKEKINASYNTRLAELNKQIIESDKITKLERELLVKEFGLEYDAVEQERVDSVKNANAEILAEQRNFMDSVRELEDLQVSEQIDMLNDSIERQKKIISDKNKENHTAELKALRQLQKERYDLQVRAIEDEYDYKLSQVEKGSIEEEVIEQQKYNALSKLKREYATESKNIDSEIKESQKQSWKDIYESLRQIFSKILDRLEEMYQKEVEMNQKKLEDQNKAVDTQRARAEQGLTNTLAFEQKEQAKKEAELIKSQKRLERVQKVKALYASYQGYASAGDKNAIAKTLKDFAILEAISATFGDGGVVEDKLPRNGIFRGPSHKSKAGGIPIMVEGKEGIFSTREMGNLGKDNFYALKELAGKGKIGSNFFGESRKEFNAIVPVFQNSNVELQAEMRMMRESFESVETQKIDILGWVNGMFQMVETLERKGKKTVNNYKIEKPQF